jgi:hypothetical protein
MSMIMSLITKLLFQYYMWIPFVMAFYVLTGYISVKNNVNHGGIWFWVSWALAFVPTWGLISKYSHNLLFDGLVFDAILIVFYTVAVLYFSDHHTIHIKPLQYVSITLIIIGLITFKAWSGK